MRIVAVSSIPRDRPDATADEWKIVRSLPRSRRAPAEVAAPFSTDYNEAAEVLPVSKKASASVSRRLLQHIIREKAVITKKTLNDEIYALVASGALPVYLADDLHALRASELAAHPTKDTNTVEVVEVEEGEAECCLYLLYLLMEFYFVRPALRAVLLCALYVS